jgi:Flp pilus assembly protein TadG
MRNLLRLIGRFRKDRRGNIAIIFGLACVPLISAIGCAVDYSMATRMKAKLQSAADAASVASISQRSNGYIAASQMTSDGSITAGVTDANNIFDGNMSTIGGYQNLNRTSTVTKTGIKLASNVQFSADVPVTFLKVIGVQTITVTGISKSSASLPPYLDFYLMVDVSGSMGIPSTDAEQGRLAGINPDNFGNYPKGCTLACHFAVKNVCGDGTQKYSTNNMCMGYAISRLNPTAYGTLVNQLSSQNVPKQPPPSLPDSMISGLPSSLICGNPNSDKNCLPAVSSCPTDGTSNCIQLRADAVGYALTLLFKTANADETVTNQFRIGLYPFIADLYEYFALTTSINGSSSTPGTINYAAANLSSQLDTNTNASLGSGGTHIDTALNTLNGLIKTVGDGSSSTNTQPYVFLVTDGAQDPQSKALNQSGGWAGSNHATVIASAGSTVNPGTSPCKALRDRGIMVSVLYIPYVKIQNPNPSFANDEDDYANWNIPNIPASLQDCATPPDAGGSYYYTANSPTEIQDALDKMFKHSLQSAHLTN